MNTRTTMMKHPIWHPLAMALMPAYILFLSSLVSAVEPPGEPMSLWFTSPATRFSVI